MSWGARGGFVVPETGSTAEKMGELEAKTGHHNVCLSLNTLRSAHLLFSRAPRESSEQEKAPPEGGRGQTKRLRSSCSIPPLFSFAAVRPFPSARSPVPVVSLDFLSPRVLLNTS